MRDTIDMAREAGFTEGELAFMGDNFRRFEALVRADEREEGQRWFDAVTAQYKQELLAKREACAKVAENLPPVGHHRQLERATLKDAASAIRARGNT
jgi:hypothetical protein